MKYITNIRLSWQKIHLKIKWEKPHHNRVIHFVIPIGSDNEYIFPTWHFVKSQQIVNKIGQGAYVKLHDTEC